MHGHQRHPTVEWRLAVISNPGRDVGDKHEGVLKKLLHIPTHVDIVQVLEQAVQRQVGKVTAPRLRIRHPYLPVGIDGNHHRTRERTAWEGWDSESTAPFHRKRRAWYVDRIEKHGQGQRGEIARIDFEQEWEMAIHPIRVTGDTDMARMGGCPGQGVELHEG